MHNLAVLYAEGIDGKPDYTIAAQWFRKAAAHGVADSQYNLAILYARGIGTEQNLAESYKWFALAADHGRPGRRQEARRGGDPARPADPDGSQARGADLHAASASPTRRPTVKTPPGGWDRTAATAQPAKPKPRPRTPATP